MERQQSDPLGSKASVEHRAAPRRDDAQIQPTGLGAERRSTPDPANRNSEEIRVVVRLVSPEIGLGVFAARPFKHGELIFQEKPVLVATHDLFHNSSTKDAPQMFWNLPARERQLMQAAFHGLAFTEDGSMPPSYQVLPNIGVKLRKPAVVAIQVSMMDHACIRAHQASPPPGGDRAAAMSKMILDWFKGYAFRFPESDGRHLAAIYLVGSLINHVCGQWNANFNIDETEIRLIARRDIEEGEELFINYGPASKVFDCLCKQCQQESTGKADKKCTFL